MKIGCIGQGFVGGSMADDFEKRGFEVIRYGLDEIYAKNKKHIKECDVVFIAVPTPTFPEGPDHSIVDAVIPLTGEGKIVVIKSTIVPGTAVSLQEKYPDRILLFSPEFLSEKTAAYDAAHPIMNIMGLTQDTAEHRAAAKQVMEILPESPHNFYVSSTAAELAKYAHNLNGYFRIILANLLYDVSAQQGADWTEVKQIMDSDVMMSPYYNEPVHKGGRGAGGGCFVKDMAAFRHTYQALINDEQGIEVLKALEAKNRALLAETQKDQELVMMVYGILS